MVAGSWPDDMDLHLCKTQVNGRKVTRVRHWVTKRSGDVNMPKSLRDSNSARGHFPTGTSPLFFGLYHHVDLVIQGRCGGTIEVHSDPDHSCFTRVIHGRCPTFDCPIPDLLGPAPPAPAHPSLPQALYLVDRATQYDHNNQITCVLHG
ncbi:hypothetical protein PILCRDRAFT_13522 [Piloderma croceum F 1598]|uniref:Uncharacterized protein n=1 Tax=Piloderma croceum (strain F 1598) TaxID=765440 RepID=A0A0C3BDQ7_PILCF|nr:hypothetical protein PILCRDRAFT_13522 [Piloderma croceum F 1598]